MPSLEDSVDSTAHDTSFSGVVRVDRPGEEALIWAYGLADRAHGIATTSETQFGIASGSKAFTALAVMSLVEEGVLALSTTARSLLGTDLPQVADDVTVEHLLAHRSGIGDYLDDDADIREYPMSVPVHRLETTEQFLAVLDGHPTLFPAGEHFSYCNGGFVLLALLAERSSGTSYHDLVRRRVFAPAAMVDSDFLRTDALPGRAALGYVEVDGAWRTNVLHLPVLATGDGGAFTTLADMHRFWTALDAGRIVSPASLTAMTTPRSDVPNDHARYGLGLWLHSTGDGVVLEGHDPGVSFRSSHAPSCSTTWTVISNTSEGAWPMTRLLTAALGG